MEGETGLLVAPKAPSELADVLLGLINDLPRARSMGHAGRQRARAEFGADRYVGEFDELYQRLAAKRGFR
jgi:glycosyltransferase involved in cell wall biosynthesis